jgi:hypothetical protein
MACYCIPKHPNLAYMAYLAVNHFPTAKDLKPLNRLTCYTLRKAA